MDPRKKRVFVKSFKVSQEDKARYAQLRCAVGYKGSFGEVVREALERMCEAQGVTAETTPDSRLGQLFTDTPAGSSATSPATARSKADELRERFNALKGAGLVKGSDLQAPTEAPAGDNGYSPGSDTQAMPFTVCGTGVCSRCGRGKKGAIGLSNAGLCVACQLTTGKATPKPLAQKKPATIAPKKPASKKPTAKKPAAKKAKAK